MTFYELFGLLVLLAYFGWLGSLARELYASPTERARLAAKPGRVTFVLSGVVLMTMFLVGVFIPAIGQIVLFSIDGRDFKVWGIGLLGSFAWLALGGRRGEAPGF